MIAPICAQVQVTHKKKQTIWRYKFYRKEKLFVQNQWENVSLYFPTSFVVMTLVGIRLGTTCTACGCMCVTLFDLTWQKIKKRRLVSYTTDRCHKSSWQNNHVRVKKKKKNQCEIFGLALGTMFFLRMMMVAKKKKKKKKKKKRRNVEFIMCIYYFSTSLFMRHLTRIFKFNFI